MYYKNSNLIKIAPICNIGFIGIAQNHAKTNVNTHLSKKNLQHNSLSQSLVKGSLALENSMLAREVCIQAIRAQNPHYEISALDVLNDKNGKPYIHGYSSHLNISLTHATHLVGACVTDACHAIGIDIEKVDNKNKWALLRYFQLSHHHLLKKLNSNEISVLTMLWSATESLFKSISHISSASIESLIIGDYEIDGQFASIEYEYPPKSYAHCIFYKQHVISVTCSSPNFTKNSLIPILASLYHEKI